MQLFFPHETIRPVQNILVEDIKTILAEKKHMVVHAPTGLGKTAAAISPALSLALTRDLTIFFLTSRQTQHKIVLDTLREIKQKYSLNFTTVSIIGKKGMCCQPGTDKMYSGDFFEYCKALRENSSCDYYTNIKGNKVSFGIVLDELRKNSPLPTERVVERCSNMMLCPYELSLSLASEAKVIVSDYNYLFNPDIRESFLKKTGKNISSSIIIIDEAHNLAGRLREQMTTKLNTRILKRALTEAKEFSLDDVVIDILELESALERFAQKIAQGKETLASKEQFIEEVGKIKNYDALVAELKRAADTILEQKRSSSIRTVAEFLETWPLNDAGFSRIIAKENKNTVLTHKCLDPSILTREVIEQSYSTIAMSGTLSPTAMYKDILGFPANTVMREFPSPFPQQNRLVLIVPQTSTKYERRSETEYCEIANICAKALHEMPKCCAIFFPSYQLRDDVAKYLETNCKKTVFREDPAMSKQERQELLERFAGYKNQGNGAVLLGAASGSFGEGIDLPGIFSGVFVVGLPFDRPDLETQELIAYYDKKFGKGWEYGYILPALTKCMQNAGRCIRSEKDTGALIFIDERYKWPRYRNAFPTDWNVKVTLDYEKELKNFFRQ